MDVSNLSAGPVPQFEVLWLDVETTGLHPKKSGVASLAALPNWETDPAKCFYREVRCWAGAELEPAALYTNGFTEEQLFSLERPSEDQVCDEFLSWVLSSFSGPPIIAGLNTQFDINFINAMFARSGKALNLRSRFLDVQDIAIFLHTAGLATLPYSGSFLRTNLNALLMTFMPGVERGAQHTCYEDVWLTRNIYAAMLNRAVQRG